MPTVVGVRLRFTKTLWFDPAGTEPREGDSVIVETERGTEIGMVVQAPFEVAEADIPAPLKPVVRIAGEEDLDRVDKLAEQERAAMPIFREMVAERKLEMKPIDVEYLFDGDRIVFYFAAEDRVDFRDLVKELASRFHARIDMRQVGVRDEARMVGGIGHCGQMLCCVRLGGEFQPVSIRMAKEQDLPLNPLKISGLCGRLMCCLRYEFDAYKDYKSRAPKRGAIIDTPVGLAKVAELNTPRETVTMRFEDGNRVTVPLASMECAKGTGCPCSVPREALEEAGVAAAISVAVEQTLTEQPSERPAAEREQGASRRKRRRKPEGGGQPAAEGASEPQQPSSGGRVPRRRAGQAEAQPKQSGDQPAAPAEKPAGGEAPEGAEGKPSRSRRRRRRRGGGGGGNAAP